MSKEEEELWGEKLGVEAIFATENVNFVAFVEQARQGKTEHKSMMKTLKDFISLRKLGYRSGDCQYGQTKAGVFEEVLASFNFTFDAVVHKTALSIY